MITAVLAKNRRIALEFLMDKFGRDIDHVNQGRGEVVTKAGMRYLIITDETQANLYEFKNYIKSPCYTSLEDLVQSRIK